MALLVLGKTPCALTGKMLQKEDYFVCFPHFISGENDPLWWYSDSCMLRDAFDAWKHHDEFLAQWADFEQRNAASNPYWRVVVDIENYLIKWGKIEKRIVVFFLKHGSHLDFRKEQWSPIRSAFYDARPGAGEIICKTADGTAGLKRMEEETEISLAFHSHRDRIRLSPPEWVSFVESLRELDRFLETV
jgi:hypothetical protein